MPLPTNFYDLMSNGMAVPTKKPQKDPPYKEILRFAARYGFRPPSSSSSFTTGGDHVTNSKHYRGEAVDLRSRDKTDDEINDYIAKAIASGYSVEDDRDSGSEPHVHTQVGPFRGGQSYILGPGTRPRAGLYKPMPGVSPFGPSPDARPQAPWNYSKPMDYKLESKIQAQKKATQLAAINHGRDSAIYQLENQRLAELVSRRGVKLPPNSGR